MTLGATVPFAADLSSFERVFACATNGTVLDLGCQLTADSHTCDWALHGGGEKYHFSYLCPYVAPACLWLRDSSQMQE